jgi:hypothetical protein
MEERWKTEGPSLARGLSERTNHTVVQVYGEAMSDYAGSDDVEAPSTPAGGRSAPFGVAQKQQHGRRRSLRQEEAPSRRPFSVALEQKDLPLPPPPVFSGVRGIRNSFVNPFSNTPSPVRPSFSTSRTLDSSEGYDDFRDSVEGAHIHTATVSPLPPQHPDDVSLYSQATMAVPLRSNSLKELARGGSLRELARAGSRRGQNMKPDEEEDHVVRPALARRPTLTRRTESDRAISPLSPPPVTGYAEEPESTSIEVLSPASKHRSLAGLIETVESFDEELDGVDGSERKKGRKDPPPGEEDRSAFFARRERMPRYSAGSGQDPRVAGRYGSISRS